MNYQSTLRIVDEDIDAELRAILYRTLQRQARNQGVNIAKIQNLTVIEYKH